MSIFSIRTNYILFSMLFFIASLFTSFNFTEAVMLKPMANIAILDAELTHINKDKYSVNFRVKNEDYNQDIGKIKYGIRVQNNSGELLMDNVYGIVNFTGPSVSEDISLNIEPSLGLSGTYQVFVVIKNESGILLANSYAGDIVSHVHGVLPTLEGCKVINAITETFHCAVEDANKNEVLNYKVYKNSVYNGNVVLDEEIEVDKLNSDFNLKKLSPGKYEVSFILKSKDGQKVFPSQKVLTFNVPGNWVSINFFSVKFVDNTLSAVVQFEGLRNGENERGFNYWVLSDTDEVCASGSFNLNDLVPYKRNITEHLKSSCIAPRFVGYLYDGKNVDGSFNIVDTIGEADFLNLPVATNKYNKNRSSNTIIIILIMLSLVLIAWYFFIYKKDKDNSKETTTVVGVLFLLLFAPFGFASASAWSSQDNPHIQFSVNLTKNAYQPDENITFAFGFDDRDIANRSHAKTPNSTVLMKVDNGTYTQIMDTSDTATFSAISVNGISSVGTHTLTFKVPDLCGSAFDYSIFSVAKFGTEDCEFQIPVEINNNAQANVPTISIGGSCTPGGTDTFTFFSTYDGDEDGTQDNVYYNIVWDDGTAGRIPLNSGYVKAGISRTSQVTWPADKIGNYMVKAKVTAQDGKESVWGIASGGCSVATQSCGDGILQMWLGEECDDGDTNNSNGCTNSCERTNGTSCGDGIIQTTAGEECDGGSNCTSTCRKLSSCTSGFGITPDKSLVRNGESVDITWTSSTSMTACFVKANGANLWNGNAGTRTRVINGKTEFELSCDSACSGSRLSTTTIVDIIPSWQER